VQLSKDLLDWQREAWKESLVLFWSRPASSN